MIETKSAGGVVLNKAGKVLVVRQGGTSWSLPKGHIEDGEDAIVAAKREIYEELIGSPNSFVQPFSGLPGRAAIS